MEEVRYDISRSSLCNFGIIWIEDARSINPAPARRSGVKIMRIYLSKDKGAVLKKIKRVYPEAKRGQDRKATLISEEIKRYLTGKIANFNLSHLQRGALSEFQWVVLRAARQIPYGRVIAYKGLAKLIDTKSARAVGNALAKNPFPIVIPCHRIVNYDGDIGGFQCGKALKKRLLRLEGITFDKRGRIPERFFYPLDAIEKGG